MHEIRPDAVYYADDLKEHLRLSWRSARIEYRAGRLRLGKRAGRVYALGAWLLAWLEQGELSRERQKTNGAYQ